MFKHEEKEICRLKAEQTSPLLAVRIDDEGGDEQADRNADSDLDHAETKTSDRCFGKLASGTAVAGGLEVVSDLIGVLQAGY